MTSVSAIAQDQDFQGASPSATDKVPSATLDSQFQSTKAKLNELLTALATSIRDDDTLVDELVRLRNLHPEVTAAIASKAGWQPKTAVAVATTAGITLSGEQTIDGVLTSGSRVLVKDQADDTENGLYVSAAGAWSRATDADTSDELGYAFVYVNGGLLNGASTWVLGQSADDIAAVGTTSLTWAQVGGAGSILPVLKGGTGATTAAGARTNLGVRAATDISAAMQPVTSAMTLALAIAALGALTNATAIAAGGNTARTIGGLTGDAKRINVLDVGCDRTGVADCYAKVQALITAADDHGLVIEFPQGYYNFSAGLDLDNKPITFIGNGFRPYVSDVRGSAQWLQSNSPTFGTALFFANTSGSCIDATSGAPYTHQVKMRDLAIIGSGNAAVSGVRIASVGLAAVLCDFKNVGIHNCGAGLVGFALYDSLFVNMDIRGCDTGISLNGSNQNVFINTQVTSCVTGINADSCDTNQFYGGAIQGMTTRAIRFNASQNCFAEGVYFENTNITDKDIYISGGGNCGIRHCHHSSNATYGGITIFSGSKHYLHHTREASGKVLIAAGADYTDIQECTFVDFTDLGTYTALFNVNGLTIPQTIQTQGGITLNGGGTASAVPGQYIGFASNAPATGTWQRGSIVFNSLAAFGAPSYWVCTASGTPGTWRAQANTI